MSFIFLEPNNSRTSDMDVKTNLPEQKPLAPNLIDSLYTLHTAGAPSNKEFIRMMRALQENGAATMASALKV
jgi:hypothetical protein